MKTKIYNLTELVKKHDILYDKGEPVITDSEYDKLYNQLVQYEKEYPEYSLEDSPTKRIYTVLIEELEKVDHDVPLLSLEKQSTEEGLYKFLSRFSDDEVFTVAHKEDGLSVKLEYREGVLQQASTRGDGTTGEDITHSIRLLDNVPNYIEYTGRLVLRGEAVIDFENFERVNKDGMYKSPRNLVSGSVRTLDAGIAKERGVKVLVFDVMNWEEVGHSNASESSAFLDDLGFETTYDKVFKNDKESKRQLVDYCTNFEHTYRDEVGHMIDGLVIKVGTYEERVRRGETSKYPRWAIAYKFDSLDGTTTLKGVEWTVGKTGQVTPNAVLEPVEIDGVLIGKASLANYANIKARDIRIGDTVVVARANDVIPQVVSSVEEMRTGEEEDIVLAEYCPSCRHDLEHELGKDGKGNEAIILYCKNVECGAQLVRVLENFVSRNAMDIDGLGEKTLEVLYQNGLVTDISSIYEIKDKKEDILKIERFGERKFERMVEGIEESKNKPLENVIKGLGIRNIGNNVSGILTDKYFSWEQLKEAAVAGDLEEYLSNVKGIGDVLKHSVLKAFTDVNTIHTMDSLKKHGCKLEQPKTEEKQTGESIDKTFVLTGTMYKSRPAIKKELESRGAKVTGSVSKNTNYLVLGGYNDKTGEFEGSKSSKHKKAEELGVTIISDIKLREIMG